MTHSFSADEFDRFAPTSTRAFAHAKLNLVLHVLAREESGYHGIETLFQALELADVVDVALSDKTRTLSFNGPALPTSGLGPVEQNLAQRAAVAFADATRWDTGWHISIEKNIPVGGGLGGGSADAAAVLRALQSLAPQPLRNSALMELAGTLGADVPFLLSDTSLAWAWDRGDRFMPLPSLPRMEVTLLTFADGVNTGAAYGAIAAARNENHVGVSPAVSADVATAAIGGAPVAERTSRAVQYPGNAFGSWSSVVGLASNDFESVVSEMHPGVARWLPVVRQAASRLSESGVPAIGMMSGSGATCFVLSPPGMSPELGAASDMRVIRTHTLSTISSL